MRLALERRAARKQAHDKLELRRKRLGKRKDELERERKALELKRTAASTLIQSHFRAKKGREVASEKKLERTML